MPCDRSGARVPAAVQVILVLLRLPPSPMTGLTSKALATAVRMTHIRLSFEFRVARGNTRSVRDVRSGTVGFWQGEMPLVLSDRSGWLGTSVEGLHEACYYMLHCSCNCARGRVEWGGWGHQAPFACLTSVTWPWRCWNILRSFVRRGACLRVCAQNGHQGDRNSV
jgi:hypothetical protein